MDPEVWTALIGLGGVLVGSAFTYLGAILKFRQDLKAEYDMSLREKRIEAYLVLWQCTQPLAKYSPPKAVTYQDLQTMAKEMRRWWFKTGGMFLTDASSDAYIAMQQALQELVGGTDHPPDKELEAKAFNTIRQKSSDLRTTLVRDVGTRRQSELSEETQGLRATAGTHTVH